MTGFHFLKTKQEGPFSVSVFECKRGSLTIRGTEYRPEGNDLPVAIVCHGFMANQRTVTQYAKELAGNGYCAYTFDFCGGSVLKMGKSDGETTDMSVLTEVREGHYFLNAAPLNLGGCDGAPCRACLIDFGTGWDCGG